MPFDAEVVEAAEESILAAELFEAVPAAEVGRAIEVLRPFVSDQKLQLFDSVLAARTTNCVVAYEKPSNPSNVWACLRTIDAFGIQSVHIVADAEEDARRRARDRGIDATPTRHAERARLMRSAMGAQKWLSLHEHGTTQDLCDRLRSEGFVIAVTDLSEGAVPASDVDWAAKPHAIIFGNEEVGISEDLREAADLRVYLPMRGFAESLNLSVSTGALLSHLSARGALEPNLNARDHAALLLRWMVVSVRASLPLLQRADIDLPKDFLKKRRTIAGSRT